MITAELVRQLLIYSPDTGAFTWRVARPPRIPAGYPAGRINHQGYVQIEILGKRYQGHRLAWLYVHGRWPPEQIDHINRVRSDNRIGNLREATLTENAQNHSIRRPSNPTCLVGVTYHKGAGKWQAQRRRVYLGLFDTPEAAHAAYMAAGAAA